MERFLYRLSQTEHVDSFVLKGALLFRIWDTPDSRATRDIDFLAYLDNSPDNLAAIIRDVCAVDSVDDGLEFDPETVEAQRIKEDADYEGVRIQFRGQLGNARIHMQVDVGFGDLIHPDAVQVNYPALLDLPAPSLRIYPPETVVAEKAEAMVHLGSLNSRMKDFYDIWRMSQQFNETDAFIQAAFEQVLSRPVVDKELKICRDFLTAREEVYRSNKKTGAAAKKPENANQPSADARLHARENLVHSLFNHHDFVTIK